MKPHPGRNIGRILALTVAISLSLTARAQFTNPSQDELKMTSQPDAPGAPAIYLEREVINDDGIQPHGGETIPIPSYSSHVRIKVLTEEGKKYAQVELPRLPDGSNLNVDDVQGRTIHADGSIVAFTGKPEDKPSPDGKGTIKVFTLPDAQVGSILEYRYKLSSPALPPVSAWILPADLYTRKLHYLWKISGKELLKTKVDPTVDPAAVADAPPAGGRGGRGGGGGGGGGYAPGQSATLSWAVYLPKGVEVNQTMQPGGVDGIATNAGMRTVELNARDIAAMPGEDNAPPMVGSVYHVVFYYSPYPGDSNEFWRQEGADWNKKEDRFVRQDPALTAAVGAIIGASDPEEAKLKKIYTAAMSVNNTDLAKPGTPPATAYSAAQVWTNKTGTSNQIAELFVAMARIAGFKAYIMAVPNRATNIFLPEVLSLDQFPDKIAIVNVAGKEQFFDPGERYCAYGHLAWQHTATRGIRQIEGGTSNTQETPGESYNASITQRVADLQLTANGGLSGPVTLYFTGSPALTWRQRALATDDAALHAELAAELQRMLPAGMTVQVGAIDNLTNPEQKLGVHYIIKGSTAGSGGHASFPGDLFEPPLARVFASDKRANPLYLHYSHQVQDVVRVSFPAGISIDTLPASSSDKFQQSSEYTYTTAGAPTSVTVRRNFTIADAVFPAAEYASLKAYYSKMEQKSRENVVLKGVAN